MHETSGCLRVRPALNEAERSFLIDLAASGRTLRGTPTGRGDRSVPFAHLAWEACPAGCCLTWDPSGERAAMMLPSLRFLVDHVLRAGATGEGRAAFAGFTFDHVVDGIVAGADRVVEVTANRTSERLLDRSCASAQVLRARRRPLPENVVELRPRRA